MDIPKIGPSEGRDVQASLRPAGQVWKKTKTVGEGILDNPTIGEAELDNVELSLTNPKGSKTSKKTEGVAFDFFEDINEANAKP
jgi:hypothetical protein